MVFSIKTACISETVSDTAKVIIDQYGTISNSYTSFRLVPRLMTLNDI